MPFTQRKFTSPTSDQNPDPGSALHPHPRGASTDHDPLPPQGLPSGTILVEELLQTPTPEQTAAVKRKLAETQHTARQAKQENPEAARYGREVGRKENSETWYLSLGLRRPAFLRAGCWVGPAGAFQLTTDRTRRPLQAKRNYPQQAALLKAQPDQRAFFTAQAFVVHSHGKTLSRYKCCTSV